MPGSCLLRPPGLPDPARRPSRSSCRRNQFGPTGSAKQAAKGGSCNRLWLVEPLQLGWRHIAELFLPAVPAVPAAVLPAVPFSIPLSFSRGLHREHTQFRFETVWNRPEPSWRHVSGYFATMTPDFSLYATWPTAVQIWNTYHSRWMGRFWQERGCRVIPTMNLSDEASFDFCFDGAPQGQVLSISVADLRRLHVEKRFRDGLDAMLERLSPILLLVCGRLPCTLDCPVLEFAPAWCELRKLG